MTESSKPGDTPADEVGVRLPEWPPLASYDEPTEVPKRATSNLGDSPYPDGVPQPNSGSQPNRRSQPEEADRGPDSSGRRPLRPVKGAADARRSIPARLRSQGIVAASFLGIILTAAALNALQRSPADPSSRLTIDSVASTAASPAAAPSESSPTQSLPLPPTPTPTHVPTQTPTQAPTSPPPSRWPRPRSRRRPRLRRRTPRNRHRRHQVSRPRFRPHRQTAQRTTRSSSLGRVVSRAKSRSKITPPLPGPGGESSGPGPAGRS